MAIRKKPKPELVDDENPEWTAEQIAAACPARKVLPQIFETKAARKMLKPLGSKSKLIAAGDGA